MSPSFNERKFDKERFLFVLCIAFFVNVIAYFVFIAHQPLHNHGLRLPWINPKDQFNHGRWFNFFVLKVTGSADLPAFLPLISITINICAGYIFTTLLNIKTKTLQVVVICLLTTFPAILSTFYYTYQTVLFSCGLFFAVAAVYLSGNLNWKNIVLGSIAFTLMMGSYQPSVSIYATLCMVLSIASIVDAKNEEFMPVFKTLITRILTAIIGTILYLLSIKITGASSHATKSLEIKDIPNRVIEIIPVSFKNLVVTQPDIQSNLRMVLLTCVIVAFTLSLLSVVRSYKKVIILLIFWFGAVLATKAMYFISPQDSFFEYRYNISLAVFYSFSAFLLVKCIRINVLRKAMMFLISSIVFYFVQADLVRQTVLLRGQQHDLHLANRILYRMESLPNLDTSRTYDLIRVGKYSNYREKIMSSKGHTWNVRGDQFMDTGDITALWADEDVFMLLGSKIKFKHSYYDPDFRKKINEAKNLLLSDKKPWPHSDSVFIYENKIIVYMQ